MNNFSAFNGCFFVAAAETVLCEYIGGTIMKRMLKKNIAILLCLCLCLSLFPAAYAEGDVPAEPDGGADVYEQVLTETGEALPEIEDRLIDEEIVLDYPEVETLYEEVPGEGEIPEETADAVRETPEEENLSGKLGTAFAGISIPQIEQNEIPESTTRRSYVSAASALLTAESFRDGLCPVLFYTEKGYDLIGLVVADGAGKVLEPAATDAGWTYLLAPGAYTYRYHDDRAIFADIGETAFTVDGPLEIALDLTAAFEDRFVFSWDINPLYEGIADNVLLDDYTYENALDEMIEYKIAESENGGQRRMLRGTQSPGVQLRNAMVARQEKTPIKFYSDTEWTQDDVNAQYQQVVKEALQHTGNHWEGDTLSLEYYEYGKSASYNIPDGETGSYCHEIIFIFHYRSTAAHEEAVYSAVESMAAGLSGLSEYQKAFAINQWLYQNVNYDYTHEKDKTYQRQFTAHAALVYRIAVCQGFAITFYRMALAAGLNARVVTSTSMGHAWNIVSIDGVWYELDSTWDSNRREGGTQLSQLPYYFLRGSTWWSTGHGNGGIGDQFDPDNTKYYDPSFDAYTLSQADYTPEEPKTYIVSYRPNGGDSVPDNQTKIHGTDLTLTTEMPARANPADVTYAVILDGNGGTIKTSSGQTALRVRYNATTKVSYSFLRWNTKANGSGTNYSPGDLYSEDASLELYARWSKHTSSQYVPLPTPTREGYYFVGWGTSPDAATGITGEYKPTKDTMLYAVWVQPDFFMPDFLTDIEEEAFAGCAFTFVKLSENTATVGPRAFADCPNLKYIYIPAETTVDPTAFENVEGLTVFRPAA